MAGEEMAGLEGIEAGVIKAILDQSQMGRLFISPWGRSRSPMGYPYTRTIRIVRWRYVGPDPGSPDPAVWELQQGIEALATITSQPSGGWQYWIPSSKTVGYSPSLREAQRDVEDLRPWHLSVV